MPFFSVIIPTFNRAHQISRALASVLNQQFKDFEVIVVDDGSTDNTDSVVAAFQDKRVRYFKKRNEERSIARNFGIKQAKGKYINFLDSDDVVYPNHLQTAYELLQRNYFPELGHLGYQIGGFNKEPILRRNQFSEETAAQLIHENVLHGNAIFIRQDVTKMYSFIASSSAVVSEDWCLWIRLAARFKIYFDNTITSAVIEHEGRSLNNINPNKLIAGTELIIDNLKKDQVFLRKYKGRTGYFFANHYTLVSLVLALTKSRKNQTLKYLWKAVKEDWKVIGRRRFLASLKHWL
jgi:glycosyltransferase involved in cell wall biosynthesis